MTHMTPALCIAAALALLPGAPLRAATPVSTVSSTGATVVDRYQYQDDALYTVRTGLGLTTQIELSPDEDILDYSTGFSSGWELTRRGNVFYLKPKNVDVDTNMMVRTQTHSYVFDLKVVATDWRRTEDARRAGVQYRIVFDYPQDVQFRPVQEAVEGEAVPLLSSTLAKDRVYNFDYAFSASRARRLNWLVPLNVWDDGRFTYIRLPNSAETRTGSFPAVFARDTRQSEDFVVNTTVEGSTLIVHGIYPYLVIRHGKSVVGLRRNTHK